jgi:hypothetical protein
VRHGEDDGFGVVERGVEVFLDAYLGEAVLIAEEPAP